MNAVSTVRPVVATCLWCQRPFEVARKGPIPHYCRQSHRQRAYELRRLEAFLRKVTDGKR